MMEVRTNKNARINPPSDYRPKALRAWFVVRVADFRALVRIVPRVRFFIFMHLTGGNESGVGGDQKFDRVESTTETRAARYGFFPQSHITHF